MLSPAHKMFCRLITSRTEVDAGLCCPPLQARCRASPAQFAHAVAFVVSAAQPRSFYVRSGAQAYRQHDVEKQRGRDDMPVAGRSTRGATMPQTVAERAAAAQALFLQQRHVLATIIMLSIEQRTAQIRPVHATR